MDRKRIPAPLLLVVGIVSILSVASQSANQRMESQVAATPSPQVLRIDAQPEKGFLYPYYLYVPTELRKGKGGNAKQTILVLPNNTGRADDDFAVHDDSAKQLAEGKRGVASK